MPEIRRQVLRQAARAAGLTAADLAAAAGVSESHMKNIIGGYENPSVTVAHRIAVRAGLNPADILRRQPASVSPLRQHREAAGIRPSELARRAGITAGHLNNLEAGRKRPSPEVADRLAAELNREAADLFPVVAA